MDRAPSFEWLLARPIAHRGCHNAESNVLENSLAAFEAAVSKNFPAELDIRLLGDGAVCVFHDENTRRLTGIDRHVSGLLAADLSSFRLRGTDQTIPLLSEVLDTVGGKVPLLIELKSSGKAGSLEKNTAALLSSYRGKAAVQSFNPHTVRWFSEHAPDIPRGQLGGRMKDTDISTLKKILMRTLLYAVYSKPHFIAFEAAALRCIPCTLVRRRGMPLLAWTVRSPAEALRVRGLCDNIIFEGFIPDPV
jgi:glycerophosphoryl diester phosphodiesterase